MLQIEGPYKTGDLDFETDRRAWRDDSVETREIPHKPRAAWGFWKLEAAGGILPLQAQREHDPVDTLILDSFPMGSGDTVWF